MPYVEYDETEAVCPECGTTFRSTEALEAHQAEVHAPGGGGRAAPKPPRAVRCSVCGQTLPSVAALARHNRGAHVE